jgi:hypothetical protein
MHLMYVGGVQRYAWTYTCTLYVSSVIKYAPVCAYTHCICTCIYEYIDLRMYACTCICVSAYIHYVQRKMRIHIHTHCKQCKQKKSSCSQRPIHKYIHAHLSTLYVCVFNSAEMILRIFQSVFGIRPGMPEKIHIGTYAFDKAGVWVEAKPYLYVCSIYAGIYVCICISFDTFCVWQRTHRHIQLLEYSECISTYDTYTVCIL